MPAVTAGLVEQVYQTLSQLNHDTAEGQHADVIATLLKEDPDDVQAALDQLVVDGRVRTATVYGALAGTPSGEPDGRVDEIARRLADLLGSRAFRREHLDPERSPYTPRDRVRFRAAVRAAVDYVENAG